MAVSVCFHGKYIPLQGVEYIIRAAHLLKEEDVTFTLIGNGQTFPMVKKLAEELDLANITFVERVPFEQLPGMLRSQDICLGIFGNTAKAARVIPNKIYEAAALGKVIITADTPAIRELFTDGENIILCRRSDPGDIAKKIILLKNDSQLRARIGAGAYRLFKERATPRVIGQSLRDELATLVLPTSSAQ